MHRSTRRLLCATTLLCASAAADAGGMFSCCKPTPAVSQTTTSQPIAARPTPSPQASTSQLVVPKPPRVQFVINRNLPLPKELMY